mmetsp:Transcript_89203/g.239009  ORF Transcript_89203/g.239009 Transcript_89203/m.239009 type:complete len:242 (-) Transcript_89203:3159-3884(-)
MVSTLVAGPVHGLLQQCCPEILEGIVPAQRRGRLHVRALSLADLAALSSGVDAADMHALGRAAFAHSTVHPGIARLADALALEAKSLRRAVVRACHHVAVGPRHFRIRTDLVRAVHPSEPDVAHAQSIHAQPISIAGIGTRLQPRVQGTAVAGRPCPPVVAVALPGGVRRDHRAHTMTTAVLLADRLLAIDTSPALLANAFPINALTVRSAVERAQLVSAAVGSGVARQQAPLTGTRAFTS